ncbi:glycosyltransferase family 39 protein [Pseudonocardia sp. MH-G8]|uniref:ArnT family glycosyltransferase n=1 Tax=Pseudonocardia sp. MH-G8 TaxID=1854588 RepID=UPI000BA12157|nr:glycosyltransferase family 39 protein [Pseudonocardia sp. MH-G8]OZM76958.1 glycosyl transferase [Pseudonocardia sp. MH-G8]
MTTLAAPEAPPVRTERPRHHRLALAVLLLGTALLYLWDLGSLGWANTYYAGAVQAMTQNWTAFLFGSTDAGNVVTVDKPPASLWVMALSARLFGLSAWSMLVPQALMGVGAVALLHAAVRRVAGPGAGLLAGAALALTPVAVEMFRYNNPDALLVLLLVGAAYAVVRATGTASTRWLLLAGALVGFAFLTKMAQAFVPLPALAAAYLVAAPAGVWRRVRQLLAAGVAIVVAGGWWYAVVELWPAASRPYIGGSESDSALELALGYNGLGRIFGREGGAGGGGFLMGPNGQVQQMGAGFGSEPGILRMFDSQIGAMAGWLLPAALALLLVGLWLTRRAPRTDAVRASLVLWGGWTVVTALVFSLAEGIFHSYYTVALAPGIAALVGIGGTLLWRRRATWAGRAALTVVTAGTAVWAWVVLGRTPEFLPWLRWAVVAVAAVVAFALLAGIRRRGADVVALALVLTTLAAPTAYALQAAADGGQGGMPGGGQARSGTGGPAGPDGGQAGPDAGQRPGNAPRPGGGGNPGTVDAELVALLRSAGTTWSAATTGAQSSASLALASDTTVMGVGGFSGGDPAPTLQEFQAMVAAGEVRWFVDGGRGPGGPSTEGPRDPDGSQAGPGRNSGIATWVQEHFAPTMVGGRTVYDLTQPLH